MNTIYSLDNYNSIIELLPDLAFIKDINGVFTHCNQNYLEFINKTKQNVIGCDDFKLLSKKDAKVVTKNDKKVLLENKTLVFNDKIQKNNNIFYFKTTKSPLYNEKNEIIGIFCIARDITKQTQLEMINKDRNDLIEYIAKEEDLTKTLYKIVYLAQSRDIDTKCSILLLDDSKTKLYCGAAPDLPEFYNQAVNGIKIGKNVGSCGAAAYNKKRVIVDNIDTSKNWCNYLKLTRKANLHSCWSEPIISSNDEVLGTFAMYTDYHKTPSDFELLLIEAYAHIAAVAIEKDKNFKQKLNQEKLILQQAKLADMGNMLANIAHQWRQPLSVISTGATGIKIKKEYNMLEDNELFQICETINDNAQYLSQTIEDFRSFLKGDNEAVNFNLKNDTENFIKLVDTLIKQYNIQLILELQEDIQIKGYPNELIQCFINIFNNSKDALVANNNENDRYVFITQTIKNDKITITFKDNAGGIKKDILNRIFEPYFTTKHKAQGTGLGLHMSYNLIVNGMSGDIVVENETYTFNGKKYKGAKFTINIPFS